MAPTASRPMRTAAVLTLLPLAACMVGSRGVGGEAYRMERYRTRKTAAPSRAAAPATVADGLGATVAPPASSFIELLRAKAGAAPAPAPVERGVAYVQVLAEPSRLGLRVRCVDSGSDGLVFLDEAGYVREPALPGDVRRATVLKTRDDGRLDFSFRSIGARGKIQDATGVTLSALFSAGGSLELGDRSPPTAVQRQLGISKKSFKDACGALMRRGLIAFPREDTRTCLVPGATWPDDIPGAPGGIGGGGAPGGIGGGGKERAAGSGGMAGGQEGGAGFDGMGGGEVGAGAAPALSSARLLLQDLPSEAAQPHGASALLDIIGRDAGLICVTRRSADGAPTRSARLEFCDGAAAAAAAITLRGAGVRVEEEEENDSGEVGPGVGGFKGAVTGGKVVFVGNLPGSAGEDDLWDLFSECGRIESVSVAETMKDGGAGGGGGFGHVHFWNAEGAMQALKLRGALLQGRRLVIDPATGGEAGRSRPEQNRDRGSPRGARPERRGGGEWGEGRKVDAWSQDIKLRNRGGAQEARPNQRGGRRDESDRREPSGEWADEGGDEDIEMRITSGHARPEERGGRWDEAEEGRERSGRGTAEGEAGGEPSSGGWKRSGSGDSGSGRGIGLGGGSGRSSDSASSRGKGSGLRDSGPSGGSGRAGASWTFELEEGDAAELDRWVEAKRAKDFETADRIRSELEANGIRPEVLRPARGRGAEGGGGRQGEEGGRGPARGGGMQREYGGQARGGREGGGREGGGGRSRGGGGGTVRSGAREGGGEGGLARGAQARDGGRGRASGGRDGGKGGGRDGSGGRDRGVGAERGRYGGGGRGGEAEGGW